MNILVGCQAAGEDDICRDVIWPMEPMKLTKMTKLVSRVVSKASDKLRDDDKVVYVFWSVDKKQY